MDGVPVWSSNEVQYSISLLTTKKYMFIYTLDTSGIWQVCMHAKAGKPQEGELYFIVGKENLLLDLQCAA